jgi:hypothetical protein
MIFFGSIASSRSSVVAPSSAYVTIPTPPSFSNTHTLIQSTTGNSIQMVDTNGKTDLLVGSNYPFLQLNGLSGSYRLRSINESNPSTWAICGGTGNAAAIEAAAGTPNVEWYNVRLRNSNNCIKMPPEAGTTLPLKTQKYQNIIVEDALFGAYLVNQSVSGQNYGNVTLYFYRALRPGGEGIYAGNTGNETTFYLGVTDVSHAYIEASGREAIQFNGHTDLRITNVTAYTGGLDTPSGIGQNNCFQIQNVKTGYLKKSIFWGFRAPAMIATNDFLFEDCFIGWNEATREIYIQDMAGNGYTKGQNTGGTITFRRCIFYNPNYTRTWMFRLQEEECNFIVEDCTFPASVNPATVVKDERSSPEAEYVGYEKVITGDYYDLGWGYRTPEP